MATIPSKRDTLHLQEQLWGRTQQEESHKVIIKGVVKNIRNAKEKHVVVCLRPVRWSSPNTSAHA